jgi:integrase
MADARARYGSGGIYQRGRIWWVRYREVRKDADGVTTYVQHQESTGSEDRDFAQRFLNGKLLALGGRRPLSVNPQRVTYEDLQQNFLARCVEKKLRSLSYDKDGQPTLATLPLLDKFFGGWRASDITAQAVRRFRREGKDTKQYGGRPRDDKRMNRYVATLRAMLRQGVKDELITSAEMPAYFMMTHEPNEAVGAIFIKPEWYAPLRKALEEPLRSAFTLAYHTAIRVHELRRLRWRDIDLHKEQITLPGSITKTGKQRIIPLPADFGLKSTRPDDPVFPLKDYRDGWHQACIKIGAAWFECSECGERCNDRECPAHGKRPLKQLRYVGPQLRHTRHTAARNMDDAGIQDRRIMDITGHVTPSMLNRYNIGKEKDVADTRRVMEEFHRKTQRKHKK